MEKKEEKVLIEEIKKNSAKTNSIPTTSTRASSRASFRSIYTSILATQTFDTDQTSAKFLD